MRLKQSLLTLILMNTSLFAAEGQYPSSTQANPATAQTNPTPTQTSLAPAQNNPAGKTGLPSTTFNEQPPGLYTFPGFVFQRDGEWIGSDYLYNLQNDIGLALDVLYPENENLEINSQKLTELALNAFRRNKLSPRLNPAAGVSALPFFYIQIMIFPTELGNVAMVSGSLFEAITLARIPTQAGSAIQAITWEKKTMFMSNRDNFEPDLAKTVEDVANTFGERWRLFEHMRTQIGGYDNSPSTNSQLPKATKPRETRGNKP